MKQNRSKSQSQTSSILFQQPTAKEMRPSRRAKIIADLKDIVLFAILAWFFWLVINFFKIAIFGV
ncbi:hypothetical protein B9T31_15935 [Acinetobacter sp. ANC 4558]|uniref:hypothetical protein n=1 Tax=Acinetobacter sp. ANC 4558 TaxID=1977876 RepID=UPI000A33F541|nr:hypothetical protein [Acinetobacter sp. ANC 4558]OTG80790.1 hypothetical protein B9T31_15935 [Acinetobacter sp. ANC 4558]